MFMANQALLAVYRPHDDVKVHETPTLELGHLEATQTSVEREVLDGEVLGDGETSTNVIERSIPKPRSDSAWEL